MPIDYNHNSNLHTLDGPRAAIARLFCDHTPDSLLDVGCGIGTWIQAAAELGIADAIGLDGVAIPEGQLLFPASNFKIVDLGQPWHLGRKFDVALCLEVAEHLDESCSPGLIAGLTRHSDTIYFSAACPFQPGQHHVNCQWPEYWQKLFNDHGYVCDDGIRKTIWNDDRIEWWYRQNLFVAIRNPELAGSEARILPTIHPAMIMQITKGGGHEFFEDHARQIRKGAMPLAWYLTAPVEAVFKKLGRKLLRR